MEIAILIGGKGSRVKKISKSTPKAFLKVGKYSIIDHQLKQLSKLKKRIFLISNNKISKFNNELRNKYKDIDFKIFEESEPLGTGGCLKPLQDYKHNNYLLIMGDLIFNIDFKKFYSFHKRNKSDITLLVHPNDHPYDSDLIEINQENQLIKFHNKPHKKSDIGNLSSSGIFLINKKILKFIKPNKFQDLSKNILPMLLRKKIKIFAYNTREYVKDVGTPKRINLVKKHMKTKKFINGNINKKLPAIFLDRDGVINKEYLNKHYQNPAEIIKGSISAVKKINEKGFLSVIVTNQPAIAKGIITHDKLKTDHKKLEYQFGLKGAYFDRIYFCPYHPEKGFKGEIKNLKKKSTWRKPDNGMFLQAIKDLNIDIKKSYMIGNSDVDYYAAKKTGIKCLVVGKKFMLKGVKNYKNLFSAVKSIT
jgi:mannose-1-phosphate guanylyltransferase/phosphomannomutase|tara:strand:- start:834 stop:2093 length:1260 start_codon:yes stop_codon:yes gene_type:complete